MKSLILIISIFICGFFSNSKDVRAGDIDPSGFSLYSGDQFYVLTDGVFSSAQNIQVRFEAGGRTNLKQYGGVDVRLYRIPKPLEFLRAQKNLHRPAVKGQYYGEGLANVLTYLWDSWFKKSRLAWQRIFSPEARKTAVKEVPELEQVPAHSYQTGFKKEPQFGSLKAFELVDSFRYPVWEAKLNEPPKDTFLEGSSSHFISTPAGNVILPVGKRKPGLYLVEAMIGSFRATTLVFVSNTLVVTKVSAKQALVWTVNSNTGLSQQGSKVVLTDGVGLLDQGITAVDGVYFSKRSIPERSFAMIEDREGGVSVSENFFYDSEIYQSKIYMFTDRPLYQPGDLVSVRAFGRELKRMGSKDVWSSLAGKSAQLSVVDSTGLALFSKKMDWDGANGGDVQFRLPEVAASGGYSLKLKFEGEDYGAAFRVARFTKPHFESQIIFDKPAYKVGEPVKGRVALMYPSGQPVVGAEVDLQLRSELMTMFEASYNYLGAMPVELSTKAYRSNERGEILFSLPPATRPSRYIVSARAMDQGAFRVSTKKEILIEGYLETFVLTSDYSVTEPGAPVKVSYVRQGSEVGDIKQALAHWQAIRLEDRSVSSGSVQAADRGEFLMKLEKPGHYVVRVVDVSGVTRATRSHIVTGPDLKSVTGQVEILADRESYAIGDQAKILLTFPFKADDALLTLERNEVDQHGRLSAPSKWFRAERVNDYQWKLSVPIREEHAPNIIFSVAYAKNGDFGFQNKGLTVKKPMIDILFKAEKNTYAPGDKVVVNVETKYESKPISALIAVGVVDEMIYVLQPEIAPAIGEFFHYQRRNQVRTSSSLSFYSFNPATSDVVAPKAESAYRDLKLLQERARRDAKDTAYWNAKLRTDANGKARFEFIMPDALTRWRITGRALALDSGLLGAVGESKSFLHSTKDLYLKWTGPTRFRNGDKPKPVMVAFNSGSKAISAEIILKGPSYSLNQKFAIKPGANSVVLEKVPEQSQLIEASILVDGKVIDALQVNVEFISEPWLVQQSKAIHLANSEKLILPVNASHVKLKILPDSTFQFLRIADDLLEYPWGCVEQTASRLIPLTMALKAFETSNAAAPIIQELRDRVSDERRRLIAMAGPKAVFTWWGNQTGSDLLLSAHAYHADWRASKLLGIEVPKANWENLLEIYAAAKGSDFTSRAYALWVLSRMNLPVSEQITSLANEIVKASFRRESSAVDETYSLFIDRPDFDQNLSLLILGSVAAKANIDLGTAAKNELAALIKSPNGPSAYLAAILLYRVSSGHLSDKDKETLNEAEKILDTVRFETPTIDRAMALAFIDMALPQAFEVKSAMKSINLGADWIKNSKSSVPSFSWNKSANFQSPQVLPSIPGAIGEVVYDVPEVANSSLKIALTRKLFRLELKESTESETGEILKLTEVKAGDFLDVRALYLDELTISPGGVKGRFLLLEVPLPPGGEVDGTTWGLHFEGVVPHFTEAKVSSSGLGYSVAIENLANEEKYHQLVRFGSRGQFHLPPARLFKMYRPSEHSYQGDSAQREFKIQ